MAALTSSEFDQIIDTDLPWAREQAMQCDSIAHGSAMIRLPFSPAMLRPGNTISGPVMMSLADVCMYAVVLSAIGQVKLAVTTSFNLNFLHRPAPADLLADGQLLKLGKRLAVIEVTLHSEGIEDRIAHATGTYSIPPAGVR